MSKQQFSEMQAKYKSAPVSKQTSGRCKWRLSLCLPICLMFCIILCSLIGDSLAGKGNKGGGDDIILYNGNIVVRGSGGKGKGKGKGGGGSIVVANSHHGGGGHHEMEMMPYFGDHWGHGFGRRRR